VPGQVALIKILILKEIKYLWRWFSGRIIRFTELTEESRSENRMQKIAACGSSYAGMRSPVGAAAGCDLLIF
jgi:hypothetical protein